MLIRRNQRWIMPDATNEDSEALRRALLVALDAIEGVREPLDDLGGGDEAEDSGPIRYDPPCQAPAST